MSKNTNSRKKKKGGKIIFLFFFFICAGCIGWFGLVKIAPEAGGYSLLYTRMYGYKPFLLSSDRYYWFWERLIPNSTRIDTFHLKSRTTTVSSEETLPESTLYSTMIPGSPRFNYDYTVIATTILRSDSLLDLVFNQEFTLNTFEEWQKEQERDLTANITEFFEKILLDSEVSPSRNQMKEQLELTVAAFNPHISIVSLEIPRYAIPDVELYNKSREAYFAMVDNLTTEGLEALMERQSSIASDERKVENLRNIGEVQAANLRNYGEILTEYPVLLDYLKISQGGEDVILPELSTIRDSPSSPAVEKKAP